MFIYSLLPCVIPKRFERLTHALEGRCSIQLSYGTILICGCKGSVFYVITKIFYYFFTYFFLYLYVPITYKPIGNFSKYQITNKAVHTTKMHNEYLHVYFNKEP